MNKASEIAQWFINRTIYDVENSNCDEYITPLKLQKLLYYAQGCYGAIKGKQLFDEKIMHWVHGPVVESIYHKYKSKKASPLTEYEDIDLAEDTERILEEVYNVFGQYSGWALRNMTHEEDPWKNSKADCEITFDSIVEYFKGNIVVD